MYGNADMISLKKSIKNGEATPETVVRSYFDRKSNPVRYHWFRVLFNYLIKVLYIVVNLVAFCGTNSLLYGKFSDYGMFHIYSVFIFCSPLVESNECKERRRFSMSIFF